MHLLTRPRPALCCPQVRAGASTLGTLPRHGRYRAGVGACDGRGADFGDGAVAGRGCSDVCKLVMSRLICPSPPASSSTLCRNAARPDDIASSCCPRFEDDAAGAGTACGIDVIVPLEDCQAKAVATPTQKVSRSAIAGKIGLSSISPLMRNQSFLLDNRAAKNRDRAELGVELMAASGLLAGSIRR